MFLLGRKILSAAGLCLFLSFNSFDVAAAGIEEGDYLWLDHGVQDDEGSSGGSKQFFIYYGQLPDKKRNISELQQLEVFCTFGEKDGQGVPVYYKLNISEGLDRHPYVVIRSKEDTWCGVLAKAISETGKKVCFYTASTSFFAQGESGESINKEKSDHDAISESINIALFRERIKEENTIFRRIGLPLSFTVRFSGKPLSKRDVLVVNDTGGSIKLKTDRWGKFVYQPWGLRRFGEDVIAIEYKDRDYFYKSTYTVFFSKGAGSHAKIRNLNFPFGVAVFFVSLFAGLILILITRRKFSGENL
ncbi:MAG: hypothetical protein JW788_07410 [Candidatus Omnitrophica bacterium]|nr:hypothetical protein [Candidatus Omnitrophota bacterium]